MHNDRILNVDEAAKLVHAAPDTLLQYIRQGELPAARLGKHLVIVYNDLVAFVKAVAARQTAERVNIDLTSNRTKTERQETSRQPNIPSFVYTPGASSPSERRRGRRRQLPQLPADSP
ncbi:helix-turn-helix domain-containing protein [Massilia sp.]|uniref:helix-turn-helix domain-containing protein n=1 Tax=Massilia sp. TaxID=1882437 RepID=UPI00352EE480